jgi:lipopolysaccharide/colanic/teichoic acid biosynthesis glycosyltransferase
MPTQNNNPATIKFWETEQRLNNPRVKVVVKRYFDMFLRFVVLFVFFIAVGLIFLNYNFPIIIQTKDIHVWVYTSKFAKRFGMPKEWVDDELKGAEALAYRLDLDVYGTK